LDRVTQNEPTENSNSASSPARASVVSTRSSSRSSSGSATPTATTYVVHKKICTVPYRVSLSIHLFRVDCSLPSCANVTSSIKPEVHNVSQRCQRMTKTRPWLICKENLTKHGREFSEICSRTDGGGALFSFFVWLGYINSFLNPVIYTIFNDEFRRAFKRLLCFARK